MSEREKYWGRDGMWVADARRRREAVAGVSSAPVWNEAWMKEQVLGQAAKRAEVRKDWQESKRIAELLIRRRSLSRPL